MEEFWHHTRHEFGLSYYGDSVSADHRLQRDISFEDDLYQADATVHADMSLKSLEAYYWRRITRGGGNPPTPGPWGRGWA